MIKKEELKKMIDDHWNYNEGLLIADGNEKDDLKLEEYLYKRAFEHGWKHAIEAIGNKDRDRFDQSKLEECLKSPSQKAEEKDLDLGDRLYDFSKSPDKSIPNVFNAISYGGFMRVYLIRDDDKLKALKIGEEDVFIDTHKNKYYIKRVK